MSGEHISSAVEDAISRLFGASIPRDEFGRFVFGWQDDVYDRLDPHRPKDVRDDV